MTSFGLIFKLILGMAGLALFGLIEWIVPLCFFVSWLILDMFGAFKRDKEYIKEQLGESLQEGDVEDGMSERQREFRRKMEEGKQLYRPDAILHMTDQDGNESSIIIKSDGEVITEGDPDPKVIEALQRLQGSIVKFGPDAIAQELQKQIEAMNDDSTRD